MAVEDAVDMARAKEHAMRHYQVRDVMTVSPMTVTPATLGYTIDDIQLT
jgi:hypothetical protein